MEDEEVGGDKEQENKGSENVEYWGKETEDDVDKEGDGMGRAFKGFSPSRNSSTRSCSSRSLTGASCSPRCACWNGTTKICRGGIITTTIKFTLAGSVVCDHRVVGGNWLSIQSVVTHTGGVDVRLILKKFELTKFTTRPHHATRILQEIHRGDHEDTVRDR